jgi:predicted DNA-binding transcriptional regulator
MVTLPANRMTKGILKTVGCWAAMVQAATQPRRIIQQSEQSILETITNLRSPAAGLARGQPRL